MKKSITPIIFFLLYLTSFSAIANLRAPQYRVTQPSHALQATNPKLKVINETLTFECRNAQCQVTANYSIWSEENTIIHSSFVSPTKVGIKILVNNLNTQTLIKQTREGDAPEEFHYGHDEAPTFETFFSAQLIKGKNTILIRYEEPLSYQEYNYSHTRSIGDFEYTFQYALWPLKEWQLDENFFLSLKVSFEQNQLPWWSKLWKKMYQLKCNDKLYGTQKEKRVDLFQRYDKNFPKWFRCKWSKDIEQ